MKVRKKLFTAFDTKAVYQDPSENIINSIGSDDDIQFYWTILSVDIENEAQATKLLKQIIGTWLTVHGNSIAGTCIGKLVSQVHLRKKAYVKISRGLHKLQNLTIDFFQKQTF